MKTLKEWAIYYAVEKGWPVFPCKIDKTPYTEHGVLDATTNVKKINEMWDKWPKANIGLDCAGAGFMVLDYDPGHDVKELENNVGPIPNTGLSASTPRGGRHDYLRIGIGEIVSPSASKLARFVDVRSFNSYVLLPPSRTADGGYEWVRDGKAAYRTDELLRVANSHREKHKDRDEWIIEPDMERNVRDAIKWLKKDAKIAVEGQGGDAMAYATAAYLKSYGISEDKAFDLMWEHWNPRCDPPWDESEVEHLETKIENGYEYNTSPPGNITSAYHQAKSKALFKPIMRTVGKNGKEWTAGRFRVVDYEGMQEIAPPRWIIPNLLPENSYALLVGASGTCKTFIALDMALSIATGVGMGDEASWPVIESSGPVLFAAGEGRSQIAKRVKAWSQTHFYGNSVPNFRLMDPVPMITEEIEPFLDAAIDASPKGKGYRLVILDTLGRSMQGTNENAQENASAFTQLVEVIQKELNCAVLALQHTGNDNANRARGSSVFKADADTVLLLKRKPKEMFITMTMDKQKDAPEWVKEKYIRVKEVHITPKIKTLVAMKAKKQDLPTKTPKSDDGASLLLLDRIEKVTLKFLANNKLKKYAHATLANAIACKIEGVDSKKLREKWLKSLREDSKRKVAGCYDPATGKWRYQKAT